MRKLCVLSAVLLAVPSVSPGSGPPHPVMTWVKRHPLPDAAKPSPRMGYETSYGYDPASRLFVRYGGHNQGGGGEQNSEVWTYDLATDTWTFKLPNDAPPGVCCAQQNVFHDALGKFVRFPAFSASHGWQSRREVALKNSSVWTYDLPTNTWRAMRPCPEVWPSPLRGAAYDPHHQVVVLHGGEGSRHGTVVYDLHANAWHSMKPSPAPDPSISQPGFTYDAVHRLFVLFGSQFGTDDRTWLYDLRRNAWRVLQVDAHPPADKSSPVLAADTRNGVVLCSVRGADGLETWALDVVKAAWKRLNLDPEPDPSGNRNRILLYVPQLNLFVLENRVKAEQQIWTFRYADAPAPKPGPRNLSVVTTRDSVTLKWEPPADGARLQYTVLRGEGTKPWEADVQPVATGIEATTWQDTGLRKGRVYHYKVRAEGRRPSAIVRAQPAVPVDLTVSVVDPRRVELSWPTSDAEDAAGWHVERAVVSVYSMDQVKHLKTKYGRGSDLAVGRVKRIGQFERLTTEPLAEPAFVDQTIDLSAGMREPAEPAWGGGPLRADRLDPAGKPYRYAVYAYRVVAVNRLGVASGPSPFAFTYPSGVQHVFSKEEGDAAVRLRWKPNPEKGIRGYVVYRLDGRWDKDPISRLTAEPIAATEFVDPAAGKGTRRYEVVAVDALGQEGEPSRPVWSRREWWRFYVPYIDEWHQ